MTKLLECNRCIARVPTSGPGARGWRELFFSKVDEAADPFKMEAVADLCEKCTDDLKLWLRTKPVRP